MAHQLETGWFAHTPAWHGLGEVKDSRPETWEAARAGHLDWEVQTEPVYRVQHDPEAGWHDTQPIDGWQRVYRDDSGDTLALQKDSYAVIGNGEFGNIIEYAMGVDIPGMPKLAFDTLCVLKQGKLIVTTLYLPEPINIPGDNSQFYRYINFWTKHDGTGGLTCGANSLRVVCANTQMSAENEQNRHGFTFSIRHTRNWADKLEQARRAIFSAVASTKTWQEQAEHLASTRIDDEQMIWFVKKWLPFSDDMTDVQRNNVSEKRGAFFSAYDSATCDRIKGTAWGLLQAAVEACDHSFPAHNLETRVSRILVHGDTYKAKASRLANALAK